MTTSQGPQHRTVPVPPRQYPIPVQLHYKVRSADCILLGFGQTRMMSGQDITFAPGGKLVPGMAAEIAIAWPRLLDNRIHLQLVLEATITSSRDGVAEAHIWAYDFRTSRAGGFALES